MTIVYYWILIMTSIMTGHIIGYFPFVVIGFLAIAGVPLIAKFENWRANR